MRNDEFKKLKTYTHFPSTAYFLPSTIYYILFSKWAPGCLLYPVRYPLFPIPYSLSPISSHVARHYRT